MNSMQSDVQKFHETFGLTINEKPTIPDYKDRKLRLALILEEFLELVEASGFGLYQHDNLGNACSWGAGRTTMASSSFHEIDEPYLVGIADALGDLLYVIFGAAITYGMDMQPLFDEIQRSNMSKTFPDGSVQRSESGKVIKPSTYSPANLAPILEKQQQNG